MPVSANTLRTYVQFTALLVSALLASITSGMFARCAIAAEPATARSHAIAMHGQPKYPAGFTHFDYTSLNAVKGSTLALGAQGSYDSLNPFIAKGNAADEMGLIYDSLTVPSADEAFTQYGLVAKEIEWPADRSWVRFYLNPDARFHDGHPITADDVVFTFNTLIEKGAPLSSCLDFGFLASDEKVYEIVENGVDASIFSEKDDVVVLGVVVPGTSLLGPPDGIMHVFKISPL